MINTRLDSVLRGTKSISKCFDIGLDNDEREAPLQSLGLLLDRGHDFLGAVQPLLGASLEHELEQRLYAVLRLEGGRAFAIGYGASPLDDLGQLLLVQAATASIVA